jgi:hypothetical protein
VLILTEATDKIQLVLGAAPAANQAQCMASWRDITASAYTPGRTVVNSNSTTDVDLVGSPGASTQRVVDFISVYNADTSPVLATIKFDANGTEYILWKGYVLTGQSVYYMEGVGFYLSPDYRPVFTVTVNTSTALAMTNATQAERFAANTSRHLFVADLTGYSQVRLSANVGTGSASANTPKFRAKYYTEYNTTVGNFIQLGASAEVEVSVVTATYVDTGWVNLAAGAKVAGACIGFTELGGDGAADPALGLTNISFR